MAENLGEGKVRIVADTSNFEKDLTRDVNASMKKAEGVVTSSTKNMNEQFRQMGKAVVSAFATQQVANFARSSLLAAEAAEQSRNRIQAIAKSMNIFGDGVGEVTDRLVEYAETTARQVGLDDDIIQLTQAKLLTFRNLAVTADEAGGAFDRATKAAIDMAAAGFGEASTNAVQLGKALQDPIKGVNALARSGITFTAEQKNMIKALVETNQLAAAQDLVLKAIEQQVGGTAESTATASAKMRVAYEELQEEVGNALLPTFQSLVGVLSSVMTAFSALPTGIRNVISVIGISTAITTGLSRTLQNLGVSANVAKTAMGLLNVVLIGYTLEAQRGARDSANLSKAMSELSRSGDDQLAAMLQQTIALRAFADESTRGSDVLAAIAREAVGTAQRIVELGLAQDVLGLSTQEATAIIEKEVGAVQQANSDLERGAALTDQAADSQVNFANATDGATQSQTDLAMATAMTNEELEEQEKALRAVLDATLASFNSEIALAQQKRTTTDAIAEFNQLQNEVTTGTYRGSDAMRDMVERSEEVYLSALRQADAAVRLAEDNAKAAGGQLSAAEAAQIQRDELNKVAQTLAPGSPLRKQLEEYIRTLNQRIPRDIRTNLTAAITVTMNQIAQNLGLSPSNITADIAERYTQRANGGLITRPEIALIGEAGPEVVIPLSRPQRALDLMRQTGLDSFASSRGRSATVNIENAVFQNGTDADFVAQKVNAAERARSFST